MANRADFIKRLKRYNYQIDRAAHDAEVAATWAALTEEQRALVQGEDYRARIYAAGYEAGRRAAEVGAIVDDMRARRMTTALLHVDRFLSEWYETGHPGSLVELRAEVAVLVRNVRNGEQG